MVSARCHRRCGFQDARTQIDRGFAKKTSRIPCGLSTRRISSNARKRAWSGITQSMPLKSITTTSNDAAGNVDSSAASATSNSSCGNFLSSHPIIFTCIINADVA